MVTSNIQIANVGHLSSMIVTQFITYLPNFADVIVDVEVQEWKFVEFPHSVQSAADVFLTLISGNQD